MANIPGTSGPVDYPNRPEGGLEGGTPDYTPMPGGTNVPPQPHPAFMPTTQMGAGVPGTGGLTPNPGEPADGSVVKGWRGSAYASSSPPNTEAVDGLAAAQLESGEPGRPTGAGMEGGIDEPDGGFTRL